MVGLENSVQGHDESELQLGDLAEIAWRRKWWFLAGPCLGAVVAFLVFQQMVPEYTARNSVLVDAQDATGDFLKSTLTAEAAIEDLMRTIENRITSESVLSKVVERVGASRLDPGGNTDPARALNRVRMHLEVKRSLGQATVFGLSYTAHDPYLAADVVREVTQTFIEEELDHRTRQSAATEAFLNREVAELKEELLEQEAKIRKIELRDQKVVPETFDERQQAISEARARLAHARMLYTDEHPEVQSLSHQLRELEKGFVPEDVTISVLSPADATLLRDYDKLLARYHELDHRRLEASLSNKVDETRQYELFRILRPAYPPKAPSWPDWRYLGAGGVAGGLALGLLLAGLAERRNSTFRTVDRLRRSLPVPVLASIPRLKVNDKRVFGWSLAQRMTRSWKKLPVDPLIVTHTAPRSVPAEQYRQVVPVLRANRDCRVILVTSAGAGDGKTLTCANLAAAMARDLERWVLIMDCDLRRPNVNKVMRMHQSPGLSDLLESGGQLSEGNVRETTIPNLWALPAGTPVSNPMQVLAGEKFEKLLEQARRDFDYVFIDSPPMLPVVDTRLLNSLSDLCVFVIRADKTPQGAVLRSLQELEKVAGVVFNGVRASNYRQYYYEDAYRSYYSADSS